MKDLLIFIFMWWLLKVLLLCFFIGLNVIVFGQGEIICRIKEVFVLKGINHRVFNILF